MAQYCDNRVDCRRAQILEYFGEIFDRSKCINSQMNTACDNCLALASNQFTIKDITQDAQVICKGLQQISFKEDITLLHLSEVLKGSMNSKVVEKHHNQLEMHGKLSKYKKNDIERVIRKLIFKGYLKEEVKIIAHTETVASYIKIGPKAGQLINGSDKFEFDLIEDGKIVNKRVVKYDDPDVDESSDGDGDDDDEEEKKKKKAKKNKKLSEMNAENRILHRCLTDVKSLIKKICAEKNAKTTIFNNKMIPEMIQTLPTTKEALLKITYYTDALYTKFDGEKFLDVFRHYSKLVNEAREEEAKKKKEQEAAAKLAATARANINNKTYGLIDDDEMTHTSEYFGTTSQSGWLNSKASNGGGNKRKFGNNYNSFNKNKKAKTSLDNSTSSATGSKKSYFAKKNSKFKKKNWNNYNKYKKN